MSNYYSFLEDRGHKIYIKILMDKFDSNLGLILDKLHFKKCDEKSVAEIESDARKSISKILVIKDAGPKLESEINRTAVHDKFGSESIMPRAGYKIYRYSGMGILIYSLANSEWELGVLSSFGQKDKEFETKVIITRFISWAIAQKGVVGFWGVPTENGVIVMKQSESRGEALFLDFQSRMIISSEGVKPLGSSFKIQRLDSTLKNKTLTMSSEELLGFLSTRTTYFDYNGPLVALRQVLTAIVKISIGTIHPVEDFIRKVDLSI